VTFPKKILITGSGGQLGKCLKKTSEKYPEVQFLFVSKNELDIEDYEKVERFFEKKQITHCINTAAFTQVEKAEQETEKAFAVNSEAVKNLAEICKKYKVILFHISTDYVFDGKKTTPYTEDDLPNPINVYGASKLKGEEYIRKIWEKHFIFRTSWLYSRFGNNFFTTVLKNAESGKEMTITTEQTGSPTNANDLAEILLHLAVHDNRNFGVYHFSNTGETTWYEFAKKISGMCTYLYAPAMVETRELRDRLIESEDIASVLDEGKQVDMALVGIGDPFQNHTMKNIGYLKDTDIEELKKANVVGDINSKFFDENGIQVEHSLNDRVIGIDLDELTKIKLVIGIAYGAYKAKSIHAALKSDYLNALIIDDTAAELLLKM